MSKHEELKDLELEAIVGGAQTQQGASLESELSEAGVVANSRPKLSDEPSF